jgi:hypothetical protein
MEAIKNNRAAKKAEPFQVGQKIRNRANGVELTVTWSSKNSLTRGDQLIYTDGHTGSTSEAWLYELAQ